MPDHERASNRPPAEAQGKGEGALAGALAAAIDAARREPQNDARWELVEELADSAQRPTDARALFHAVLEQKNIAADVASLVGQRAVRFYEAWYGDDATELPQLLARVLEIDPGAHWAFERLTVALTVGERWDELLAAYDRAIEGANETARRMKLLDEAAQAAKDFASQPDRAIGYQQKLFALDPDNAALAASLERLLERQGRWKDLIDLWGSRIHVQPAKQQRDTRLRMAAFYFEALHDHAAALAEIERVRNDAPEYKPAFDLLEKLLAADTAPEGVRRAALGHLKEYFVKGQKRDDVVRVLELGLSFVQSAQRGTLLREIVERLLDLHEDARALGHQAVLLVLDPMPKERDALRALAERTRDFERYASALREAAAASKEPGVRADLLMEAARVREETLSQPERAIELYREVFDARLSADVTVQSGRKLVKLLEQTDNAVDTLDVLSRMSELEPVEAVRRGMLGKIAQLADKLGDKERARKAWRSRVGDDTNDIEALGALIDAAARDSDHEGLAKLLRQRIEAPGAAHQRRADLVWLAKLYDEKLKDVARAIDVWREIGKRYGEDREAVTALTDLLSRAERWPELADVLSQAAASEITRFTELQTQLGDAYRQRLGKPENAVRRYRSALQVDPKHEGARAGQRALLEDEACRPVAVDSLAEAFAQTDEWQATLSLLDMRLLTADSDAARAELLVEAGELYETRGNDPQRALAAYRRAFTFLPDDRATEREIRRLAEALGSWDAVVAAYRETLAILPKGAPRAAELRYEEGVTLETRLQDREGALAAYRDAAGIAPDRAQLANAAVRVSASLGRWEDATQLLVSCATANAALLPSLLATIETAAREAKAWEPLCVALSRTVDFEADVISPAVARDLHVRVAALHTTERKDARAAEESLARAVHADPTHKESLLALAALQRATPSAALVDTLEKLAAALPEDLDALCEAGELALDHLQDRKRAQKLLERAYERALGLWRSGAKAAGQREPEATVGWVVERLATLRRDSGDPKRALDLLLEAIMLPFDVEAVQGLRHDAAELARGVLQDVDRAIVLYRDILAIDPRDAIATAALAELYVQADRLPELLSLRRHELAQAPSAERKLALRLEVARLLGELEARGDRVSVLEANLADQPGHVASLAALSELLRKKGQNAELVRILEAQARALREQNQVEAAARLWREIAQLRERELSDVLGAMKAYRELHGLEPYGDASGALARLCTSLGDHSAAAEWLEVRLGTAPPESRAITAVELARAHIEAGQLARARGCLEQALTLDPAVHEARDLLADLYRADGAHEQLAQLLSQGASLVADSARRLAYLREAAELYCDKLAAPERAIPVLTRAVELAPDDARLRGMLAEGLHIARRFDEARALLRGLIDGFGRRRSPERAALHYQLARVAESAGAIDEALNELDIATKMDLAQLGALHMLARLARDQGDLDRAERAYRGLLLVVRRQKIDDADAPGASEVCFELYRIAIARGQSDQAEELLESALESATQNDVEARRFARVLRARGEVDLLVRVLDARLVLAREPAASAEILSAKADVLEHDRGKPEEALELRLRALELSPETESLHTAARALCKRVGEQPRYLDALGSLIEAAQSERSKAGAKRAAQLTLRQGRAIEEDLGDLDRAAGLYAKVEASGECVIEAWLALARVAGGRGDRAEERRVLARIADLSEAEAEESARREARFLLAELELSRAEWRDAGVASLTRALAETPDYPRAKTVLMRAIEESQGHPGVLTLFERVARSSHDDLMLLDFIERKSAREGATLDDTREGIELSLRIGEIARAEALLTRAAALVRKSRPQRGEASWVFSALAECRLQAGDVRSAIAHLREALDHAADAELETLGRELAELAAGPGGDLQVAADAYARLLQRDPADRALWQPMLAVLAKQKDRKRFDTFVANTLAVLLPVEDRTLLLFEQAKFLIDVVRKEKDAIPVLKQILDEDAMHLEATDRLLAILQRHGMNDELADMLRRSFDRARDERNVPAITQLGLRLGELYGPKRAAEACDAFRAALEWAPDHHALLAALLARIPEDTDPRERATLEQRLLRGETGEAAAKLALRMAETWSELGDDARVREALELGHAACPAHDAVRDRLEGYYFERQLWQPLAALTVAEAERLGPSMAAVGRLKNAATLYRDQLHDVDGAASALRSALAIVPEDLSLLAELARNLAAAGQHDTAIADVTRLCDAHPQADSGRVDLLRVRADLFVGAARIAEAAADLEEAYAIAPSEVGPGLIDALTGLRRSARSQNDLDLERSATLRLVRVLDGQKQTDQARDVLAGWVERDPGDLESLRALRARDLASERYADVATTCLKLVAIEQSDARIDAALGLADAYDKLGRPGDALSALLQVHEDAPDALPLRARLRTLLSAMNRSRELAALLIGDAARTSDAGERVQLLLQAAQLYLDVGEPQTAIKPLGQAMELAPDDDRTRLLLVDVQIGLGRTEEATAIVDRAINAHKRRRSPELALFQQRMGRICALRGDRQTQLKWLNTALDTDRKSGEVASELVDVSMAIEDYDTAMKALRTLTMMEDPKPMTRAIAFLRQAQIAVVRGDPHRAQHWARKAKSLDENLAEIDEFLAKLG